MYIKWHNSFMYKQLFYVYVNNMLRYQPTNIFPIGSIIIFTQVFLVLQIPSFGCRWRPPAVFAFTLCLNPSQVRSSFVIFTFFTKTLFVLKMHKLFEVDAHEPCANKNLVGYPQAVDCQTAQNNSSNAQLVIYHVESSTSTSSAWMVGLSHITSFKFEYFPICSSNSKIPSWQLWGPYFVCSVPAPCYWWRHGQTSLWPSPCTSPLCEVSVDQNHLPNLCKHRNLPDVPQNKHMCWWMHGSQSREKIQPIADDAAPSIPQNFPQLKCIPRTQGDKKAGLLKQLSDATE